MSTPGALPNELLIRIIDELATNSFGHSNPVYSLIVASKRFYSLALPALYRAVTINSIEQLNALVDKGTSGAWKLPPSISIRDIHINAAYLDNRRLFGREGDLVRLSFGLAELVRTLRPGYLEELSIRILPILVPLAHLANTPSWLFQYFGNIQAKSLDCRTADAVSAFGYGVHQNALIYARHFAAYSVQNPCLERLRLSFWYFSKHLKTFSKMGRIKSLHISWPLFLRSRDVATLSIGLEHTLEEKGLIIDAPASEIPSSAETAEYLARNFQERTHSQITLASVRTELAKKGANIEVLMGKLDWRVSEEFFEPFLDDEHY